MKNIKDEELLEAFSTWPSEHQENLLLRLEDELARRAISRRALLRKGRKAALAKLFSHDQTLDV